MNSLCVCDAYGMCPQGCAHCDVCSGTDVQAVPPPADAITAACEAMCDCEHAPDKRHSYWCSSLAFTDLLPKALAAAAPAIAAQAAAEFYRDVEALMAGYRDDSRDVIAAVPFAASLMQLACEKFGVKLDGPTDE